MHYLKNRTLTSAVSVPLNPIADSKGALFIQWHGNLKAKFSKKDFFNSLTALVYVRFFGAVGKL